VTVVVHTSFNTSRYTRRTWCHSRLTLFVATTADVGPFLHENLHIRVREAVRKLTLAEHGPVRDWLTRWATDSLEGEKLELTELGASERLSSIDTGGKGKSDHCTTRTNDGHSTTRERLSSIDTGGKGKSDHCTTRTSDGYSTTRERLSSIDTGGPKRMSKQSENVSRTASSFSQKSEQILRGFLFYPLRGDGRSDDLVENRRTRKQCEPVKPETWKTTTARGTASHTHCRGWWVTSAEQVLGVPCVNAGGSKEGDGNGVDSSRDSQKNQTLLKKRKWALFTRKCHWLGPCEAVRGFPNHHTTPVAIYRSW
jgi:hypothetical protein